MPDKKSSQQDDETGGNVEEGEPSGGGGEWGSRRKRTASANKTNDDEEFISFCNRYAKAQKSIECEKMIPGAYTLGTGFDIKYENSENARRKSVIVRYCNYQK